MKKTLLTLTLLLAGIITMSAQELKIGYFSYDSLLTAMPEYAEAQAAVDTLRKQYDEELQAVQNEFNEKYELFLDQQASLAEAIRQKRQADLQLLMERNEQFAKEAARLLQQAEVEAMAPAHDKLKAAITRAGEQQGYTLIVNTDSNATPFLAPATSEDASAAIKEALK